MPPATAAAPAAEAVGRPASRVASRRTRERILDAATREFAERGFDAGRMDEIALRAGIAKNAVYYYFGSKDEMFSAVLERTYAAFREHQRDLQVRALDPVEGMRQLVMFTGRTWARFPHFQRLLHSENLHGGRHVAALDTIPRLYDPLVDTLKELLARGHASGVFRADVDPVDLYISISALSAHYLAHRHTLTAIFGKQWQSPTRLKLRLEHAAEMILAYLRAAPPTRKPPARKEAGRRAARGADITSAPARPRAARKRAP
jgi:TetR/AcrR family transcriptional regulator